MGWGEGGGRGTALTVVPTIESRHASTGRLVVDFLSRGENVPKPPQMLVQALQREMFMSGKIKNRLEITAV